jgi:hypothetical protein
VMGGGPTILWVRLLGAGRGTSTMITMAQA